MEPPLSFGDWLQQRRKALALTGEQLAQRVGCSISTLRQPEAAAAAGPIEQAVAAGRRALGEAQFAVVENYRPGFTATVERNVCTETLRQVGLPPTDLTFADGFESGNLSAWSSSVTDSGDLSVSTGAALIGSYGMAAVIDDINAIYVLDDTPAARAASGCGSTSTPTASRWPAKTATPSCARSRRAGGS